MCWLNTFSIVYYVCALSKAALLMLFFFNDTATTEIYTLSLHDALPISAPQRARLGAEAGAPRGPPSRRHHRPRRSEEHTSELQSRQYLVCRLLLEKKKKISLIVLAVKVLKPKK